MTKSDDNTSEIQVGEETGNAMDGSTTIETGNNTAIRTEYDTPIGSDDDIQTDAIGTDKGVYFYMGMSGDEDGDVFEMDAKTKFEPEVEIEIETDDAEQEGPDGGWGWFIVLGCVLTLIITGGMERSAGVLFLRFKDRFGQSAAVTAWVTSLSTVVDMMSGPISSSLSNRFSGRMVVIFGSLLSAISIIASGFTPNLAFLFFSYGVVAGFGRSCMYVPAMVLVGLYFNRRRGLAVGVSSAGIGLGAFFIPPLVEVFFTYYGFTSAFIMLAGVVLQVMICGSLYRPLHLQIRLMAYDRKIRKNTEEQYNPVRSNESEDTDIELLRRLDSDNEILKEFQQRSSKLKRPSTITLGSVISKMSKIYQFLKGNNLSKPKTKFIDLSLLKNFRFFMLCLAIMLFYLAFLTTNVFIPAYAKEQGLSDIEAASQLSFTGMLGTISRVAAGIILDLKKVRPYRIFVYTCLMYLTSLSCMIIPSLQTFVQLSVSSAIYGVLTGSFLSQNSIIVIDVLGLDKLTSSFGIIMCFQGIGALCGPSIAGFLKDRYGTFDTAFYFAGSGVLLGAIILSTSNIIHCCKQRNYGNGET